MTSQSKNYNFIPMLSLHQKLDCFVNLCSVATADNYLTLHEKGILLEAARKFDIPELKVWDILKNVQNYKFVVPEDNVLQRTYIEHTVEVLIVENDLSDQAYEWCLAIAKLLGLNEVILQKIIDRIYKKNYLSLIF